MGCHDLLQGIFLIKGSNVYLLCLGFFNIEPPGKPREDIVPALKNCRRGERKMNRTTYSEQRGRFLGSSESLPEEVRPGESWTVRNL